MMIFSPLLEKMFANRGYTESFLTTYEQYDPSEQMLNARAFCERLRELRLDPTCPHIVFMPDFDMDGIMSGVVGFAGLFELGFNISLHVPDPKDGYGFNKDTIDRIVANYPGVKVLITADNGISCHEGVAYAKQLGLEVLLTDHHKQDGGLPAADFVVDPMQEADTFSMPYICGANVIYQLLQLYADMYGDNQMKSQIRRLRVFAGIGTVSDSMPLLNMNRQLVRDAIAICKLVYANGDDYVVSHIMGSPVYRSAFYGLKTVLDVFTAAGKLSSKDDIDEQFFGFYLAPMFNSVKRMDGDMMRAFGVFFSDTKLDDANYLYELNERRKTSVAAYLEELQETDNAMAPYVYITTASRGLAGLLATQLMDIMKGPCIVVRREDDGTYAGSGRSPAWYPFLTRASGHFCAAAGHESAFGIHFDSWDDIQKYFDFIQEDTADVLQGVDLESFQIRPDFVIDPYGNGDIGIDIMAFMEFLDELERYRPFGVSFEEPCVLLRFYPGDATWQLIGSMKQHLKLRLPYGFEVLVWNASDKIALQTSDEMVSLYGKLSKHTFRDVETVQFIGNFV